MKTTNSKIKLIFMGTPRFSVPILEMLQKSDKYEVLAVVTEPDRVSGRNQQILSPIKNFAQKLKLPLFQPSKIIEIVNDLEKLKPNVMVVTAYGQIIPKEILEIAPLGIVNVHPSLLPKWRGASPIQYTLLADDKITGTTIMLMDEKMDTGPILAQEKLNIDPNDNFATLSEKLSLFSAKLLEKTLSDYVKGIITPKPQDDSKATYTKLLKKEMGLLDFKKSARELENQIKAFCLWPKSYCFWLADRNLGEGRNKKIIIIKKAKALPIEPEPPATAGTVFLEKETGQIAILTGKGSLVIETLQLEGKKEMSSRDFLNGHPKIIGSILKSCPEN